MMPQKQQHRIKVLEMFADLPRSNQLLLVSIASPLLVLLLLHVCSRPDWRLSSVSVGANDIPAADVSSVKQQQAITRRGSKGHQWPETVEKGKQDTLTAALPAGHPCDSYDYVAELIGQTAKAASPHLEASTSLLSSSADDAAIIVAAAAAVAAAKEAGAAAAAAVSSGNASNAAAAAAAVPAPYTQTVLGQVTELYQWYHHLQGSKHLAAATPSFHCLATTFSQGPADRSVTSQAGEDGIIEAIQSCINTTDKFYVEFGTQDGSQCTTRFLREAKNWTGLLMDGGYDNGTINLHKEMVFAENIVSLFQKYHVPHPTFDMLTVDIDLNTAYLLRAVLAGGYRPRMMVVEYNRNFAPSDSYITAYAPDEMWAGSCYFGGSGLALERIARAFGYSLVAFDRVGLNVYFVRNDILGIPFPHSFANLTRDPAAAAWGSLHEDCRQSLWMYVEESPQLAGMTWMTHLFPVLLSHRDSRVALNPQQQQQLQQQLRDLTGPKPTPAPASLPPAAAAGNASQHTMNAAQQQAAAVPLSHWLPPAPATVKSRTFYEMRLTSELAVLPCGNPSINSSSSSSINSSSSSGSSTVSVAAGDGGSSNKPQAEQSLSPTFADDGAEQRNKSPVNGVDSHRRRRQQCRVQWLQHLQTTANFSC